MANPKPPKGPKGPGWYPDPVCVNTVRFYDGHEWTADTAPAPYMAPAGSVLNNFYRAFTALALLGILLGIFVVLAAAATA